MPTRRTFKMELLFSLTTAQPTLAILYNIFDHIGPKSHGSHGGRKRMAATLPLSVCIFAFKLHLVPEHQAISPLRQIATAREGIQCRQNIPCLYFPVVIMGRC